MAAIFKAKIRLRQSMCICLKKNNPAKFHLNPIWNDGALGFFSRVRLNKKNNNNKKMSSDMRSVPDLKHYIIDK